MADALRLIGISVSEPMALGLGAGVSFMMFEGSSLSPTSFFLGRSITYERDLCRLLGIDFMERSVASFSDAWTEMRGLIDGGEAVLLLSDVKFLPHYETNTHFNGHRIVLAGYETERDCALVADTHFPGLREVPMALFEASVTSDAPPLTTTDVMFATLSRPAGSVDLSQAARIAIRENAANELEENTSAGVGGVERLARKLPKWGDAPDWVWRARFAYQVIEKRGNGGGLFRRLYARFLDEIGEASLSGLAFEAAESWTALGLELKTVSEASTPSFARAGELAVEVARRERLLWETVRAPAHDSQAR